MAVLRVRDNSIPRLDASLIRSRMSSPSALRRRRCGFAAGLGGGWDVVALVYFVVAGSAGWHDITSLPKALGGRDKVAYFEGTPIPTSVVLTAVLALAAWTDGGNNLYGGVWSLGWDLHPLALLFALSGTLMISKTLHIS